MDPKGVIAYRLFRDHCSNMNGVFVKDLGLLGRDLSSVIMIDNAAASFQCQPKNGIECIPFIDNFSDNELREMTPFLEYLSKKPVRIPVIDGFMGRMFACLHICGMIHELHSRRSFPIKTREGGYNVRLPYSFMRVFR